MKPQRAHRNQWLGIAVLGAVLSGLARAATETPTPVPTNATPARATTSARTPARTTRPTLNTFSNIFTVNIFNPWRTRERSSENDGPRRPTILYDRFAVTGTFSDEKVDWTAFFDGTKDEYKRVLRKGATIGGFKISEITLHSVKLEAEGKTFDLQVGMQLSKPPGGDWEASVRTDSSFVSLDSSSSGESGFDSRRDRFNSEGGQGNTRGGRGRGGRNSFGSDGGGFGSGPTASPVRTSSSLPPPSTQAEVDEILKKLMEARENETK